MNKLYTDFDLSLELNENTNDLKDLTDEDIIRIAIKNSVKEYTRYTNNTIFKSRCKKDLTSAVKYSHELFNSGS